MVLTLPSVCLAVVAGLTLLVAFWLGLRVAAILGRDEGTPEGGGPPAAGPGPSGADDDPSLLAGSWTLLVLLLVGWALVHATLQSMVDHVPGAMCIFGVTRDDPLRTAVMQAGRPVALFLIGLYLLLDAASRQVPEAPSGWGYRWLLGALVPGVAALAAVDLSYVFSSRSGSEVTCCNTVASLAPGSGFFFEVFEKPVRWLRAGGSPFPFLGLVAVGATASLVASPVASIAASRRPAAAAFLVLLPVAAAVTLAGWRLLGQEVAPRLLGLPYHPCLYDLLPALPDSALFLAAFLAAGAALASAPVVVLWAPPSVGAVVARRLLRGAALGYGVVLVMVAVHLAAARLRGGV